MIRAVLLELLEMFCVARTALWPSCCRFSPTCSEYARQALTRRPLWNAILLIAWRLVRCQPFHPGGTEPLPAR